MPSDHADIILYDADCRFCRWLLAKLLTWDRRQRLRPVALDDADADRLLAGMERRRRFASWHLVTAAGELFSGGAATAPLLRRLPGGKPLAWLAAASPRATERAYRLAADHRGAFGGALTAAAVRRADARLKARTPRRSGVERA